MATDFIGVQGTRFAFAGEDFPVAGTNCYYLGYSPPEAPNVAESVLDSATSMALNVLRMWAFLEPPAPPVSSTDLPWGAYFQYLDGNTVKQNDSATGLARLDRAVALAARRGIRLILVLTNSLPDFGGMDQYTRWLSANRPSLFHDEFYDRSDLCAQYEAWLRYLVLRRNPLTGRLYRDEPAILAWELANEPRCFSDKGLPVRGDCASSGRILSWAARMSKTLKSIDPNHLVAMGDEGFFRRSVSCNFLYNGSEGIDGRKLLDIPTIDFGTFHLYPQGWKQNRAFGARWINQHLKLGRSANKPMLLEEFGVSLGDGFVRDAADRDVLYAEWLSTMADQDGAGTLFWMLAGDGPDGQRFQNADPYCLFSGQEAPSIVANARNLTGNSGVAAV